MWRLVLLALCACSYAIPTSDGLPAAPSPTETAPDQMNPYDPPPRGPDGGSAQRCRGLVPPPSDEEVRIRTPDGRIRLAQVHVPRNYDPRVPMPLVLNFHGFLSNPWQQEILSEMKQRSETRGFIVVYPQASGEGLEPLSWNAGVCCPPATDKQVDDVGFVRLLLDRLALTLCIDPARVYATGMSNGGFFAYRLACELADRIAAVAPVAGQSGLKTCTPARPVPILHIHGTADTLVPYGGGTPPLASNLRFPSVQESINGWVERNGCRPEPRTQLQLPDSRCVVYPGCRAEATVMLCTVERGGHSWPGGPQSLSFILGYTSPHLRASDLMIDFFLAHPRP
ncbi:MAG: PHB depolymerase family esterase [Myxococcales bacterium]|nr:hypothetical protein [Myxococcota bacterium]MDW8282806.1 PHB depolymerase family esterase [Myxococcales bacterium]